MKEIRLLRNGTGGQKMGRLIDADKLILHLNDYALQEAPFGHNDGEHQKEIYETIQECIKAVEEQPTVFDMDSVINELNKGKFIESETVLSDIHQGYNAGLCRAIDIVKKGGRDEEYE